DRRLRHSEQGKVSRLGGRRRGLSHDCARRRDARTIAHRPDVGASGIRRLGKWLVGTKVRWSGRPTGATLSFHCLFAPKLIATAERDGWYFKSHLSGPGLAKLLARTNSLISRTEVHRVPNLSMGLQLLCHNITILPLSQDVSVNTDPLLGAAGRPEV